MNKRGAWILLILIGIFSISALAVAAAPSIWDSLFGPFGNIELAYAKYSPFINMIFYLVIFIGLAQWTLGKRFREGGKAVIVGIGIIMALGLALWEKSQELNLIVMMGPIAMMAFMGVMAFALYEGLTHSDFFGRKHKALAAALAYIMFFAGIGTTGVMVWMREKMPLLGALLLLLFIACVVGGIVGIYHLWWGRKKNGVAALDEDTTPQDDENLDEDIADIDKERKVFKKKEPKLVIDKEKEDDPKVQATIGGLIKEMGALGELLRRLEEDIAVHKRYHEKHTKLYADLKAKNISHADLVEKEAASHEAYSKEHLHFELKNIMNEIIKVRERIDAALAAVKSLETKADLKGLLSDLQDLDKDLKHIEKWTQGGA